jgi:hypothetical protein
MILFSVICLVVVIIVLTHLLNWMWRWIGKDGDDGLIFAGAIGTIIYCLMIYGCVRYIILWGAELHLKP